MSGIPSDRKVVGQFKDYLLSAAGFVARLGISFMFCLWLCELYYMFFVDPWVPKGPEGSWFEYIAAKSFMIFLSIVAAFELRRGPSDELLGENLVVLAVAVLIAVFWGKICRRRCGPARDWF